MVENIEKFGAELGGEAFLDFRFLHHRQIPVLETQVAEDIAPGIADSSQRWWSQSRVADGVTANCVKVFCAPILFPTALVQAAGTAARVQPGKAEAPEPDQQGVGMFRPALKSLGLPVKFQGWPKVLSSFTWLVPLKSLVKSCTPHGEAD